MVLAWLVAWGAVASFPPSQASNSARQARIVEGVRAMADSLAAVRGAGADFRKDLARVSGDLVRARADRVRNRCAAAAATAVALDSALAAGPYAERVRAEQDRVRQELAALRRALGRCVTEHTVRSAVGADTARAWGPYRLAQLERAVRCYEASAFAFKRRAGFR